MTLKVKIAYLEAVRQRYYRSSKSQKTLILNELCEITGFSRKYAIRILAKGHHHGPKKSGRRKIYSSEAIIHLRKLWHIMGRMCSPKMVSALPIWLQFYQGAGFCQSVEKELIEMSSATIDRYLRAYKAQFYRNKRSGTRAPSRFKNIIPLKPFTLKVDRPGYIEADTVAHCGSSLSGKFIWTLTITDIYSGWTNCHAMYGKVATEVISSLDVIGRSIPYNLISCNVDNGTEFLNKNLYDYFRAFKGIEITRSRPYRKNDNCYVEQKNFTHVREVFGYERLDHENLINYMNEIYTKYHNVLHNFFVPQQKLREKSRIGSKYIRKYDAPKTPYQRLMESNCLSMKQKSDLENMYTDLNPIELKQQLAKKYQIFARVLSDYQSQLYEYSR
jgi:hypothetical protein